LFSFGGRKPLAAKSVRCSSVTQDPSQLQEIVRLSVDGFALGAIVRWRLDREAKLEEEDGAPRSKKIAKAKWIMT
jgi:hypothetical protein